MSNKALNGIHLLLIACCTTALTGTVYAEGWSVGVGVATEQLPYRDYDQNTAAFPIITYQGERFFIEGAKAGVFLINTDKHQLKADVHYSSMRFKPSDSEDDALRELDKRKATLMAGMEYQYDTSLGNVYVGLAADVLGRSDGIIVDTGYKYPLQLGKFHIEPNVGVQWHSSDYNDYYYGVSDDEAKRSALKPYRASSGVSPYVSVTSQYAFNENWKVLLFGRYEQLSSEVKDSPMTEKSYHYAVGTGLLYTF